MRGLLAGYLLLVTGLLLLSLPNKGPRKRRAAGEAARMVSPRSGCVPQWTFIRYNSSPWERRWLSNIREWQGKDDKYKRDIDYWKKAGGACEKVQEDLPRIEEAERELKEWKEGLPTVLSDDLFSTFTYENSCTKERIVVHVEPLVSLLRNPRAVCFDKHKKPSHRIIRCAQQGMDGTRCLLLNKDYLLFPRRSQFDTQRSPAYPHQKILFFDLGASVYDAGAGGASQKWFVETFQELGWKFDRILAWEVTFIDPAKYWKKIPPEVKPIITYYNIPVKSDPASPDNPWHYVRNLCKPEDYCLVKLDIDFPVIEEELVTQLRNSPDLLQLVDEFVWEHHVKSHPMARTGGWDYNFRHDLATSYEWFYDLRSKGVRAHSWI